MGDVGALADVGTGRDITAKGTLLLRLAVDSVRSRHSPARGSAEVRTQTQLKVTFSRLGERERVAPARNRSLALMGNSISAATALIKSAVPV